MAEIDRNARNDGNHLVALRSLHHVHYDGEANANVPMVTMILYR